MAKKITKEGIKNWFRNNWAYVVAGEAVIATIVLAVLSGKTNDSGVIDPYVIDRAKDDWMDELYTGARWNGKELTVRQIICDDHLNCCIIDAARENGVLTSEITDPVVTKFVEEWPESAKALEEMGRIAYGDKES